MTRSGILAIDLDAIEARCAAATPGPWESGGSTPTPGEVWVWEETGHHPGDPDAPDTRIASCSAADGAFIAHARTDVPALVAEVRRLRAASATPDRHEAIKAGLADYPPMGWAEYVAVLLVERQNAEQDRDRAEENARRLQAVANAVRAHNMLCNNTVRCGQCSPAKAVKDCHAVTGRRDHMSTGREIKVETLGPLGIEAIHLRHVRVDVGLDLHDRLTDYQAQDAHDDRGDLLAEVARLRALLEPLACRDSDLDSPDHFIARDIRVDECRAIRRALDGGK